MTAHIRLVSPKGEERPGLDGEASETDGAPVGLPEEGVAPSGEAGHGKTGPTESRDGERRDDQMLGEAPPPLVAEPEDRSGLRSNRKTRRDGGLASLIGRAWRRKPNRAPAVTDAGNANAEPESGTALGKRGDEDAGTAAETLIADGAEMGGGSADAVKAARPRRGRKAAIAVVLLTGVAAAAIVVLNWPHGPRPQAVEPGMLADQPAKVMAPTAALATVPPREEPNVAGERPQVHQTRRDEFQEVLSFKGLKAVASPPASVPPEAPQPIGGPVATPTPPSAAPSPPTLAAAVLSPDQPVAAAPTPGGAVPGPSSALAAPASDKKSAEVASLPPAASPPAAATVPVARATVQGTQEPRVGEEPGLGETARIAARLSDLETAMKARSNATLTRADVDKAETQTSDQIARLAAIVTRLTGQVKDMEDQVRTLSAGSEEKFADLTRRVSIGESNRAVAAAETAASAPPGAQGPVAGAGVEGQAQGVRMKVAAVDQKRSYRIQAASPGLAMLSAVDGSPDDRPVEVAIGTVLPGYGKVLSIEQHGQAWVVKADRGSIE
jgi:hypothetical protein